MNWRVTIQDNNPGSYTSISTQASYTTQARNRARLLCYIESLREASTPCVKSDKLSTSAVELQSHTCEHPDQGHTLNGTRSTFTLEKQRTFNAKTRCFCSPEPNQLVVPTTPDLEDAVLPYLKKATAVALHPGSAHLLELVQRELDLRKTTITTRMALAGEGFRGGGEASFEFSSSITFLSDSRLT